MKKLLTTLIVVFVGCSQSPVPKGILLPNEMQKVVYDILRVDDYVVNTISRDTTVNIKKQRSIYYEEVFKLHNTNRKQFYASYKYYQQHPDLQKTLYDSISAEASKETDVKPRVLPVRPFKDKKTLNRD